MIRRRLVAAILAVVAGVTGVAGVLIVDTLEDRLIAGVDRELETRRVAVTPPSGGGFGRRPPPPPSTRNDPGSPFDVRRYAFVALDPQGKAFSTVATGPTDDPCLLYTSPSPRD